MKPKTKAIRDTIKHIDGAWARVFGDGVTWAGSNRQTRKGAEEVMAALVAAGFNCAIPGKPGTAGEHIVEIYENQAVACL